MNLNVQTSSLMFIYTKCHEHIYHCTEVSLCNSLDFWLKLPIVLDTNAFNEWK